MISTRRRTLYSAALVLLIVTMSCGLPSLVEVETPTAEAQLGSTELTIFPAEETFVHEPGGAELALAVGSLSEETEVTVERIGEGVPFAAGSPFQAASEEYFVDLGQAEQIGEITMSIPLPGSAKEGAPNPVIEYLAWTEPEAGFPSVVGAIAEEGQVHFPIVGSGKYQLYEILSHAALLEMMSTFEPLAVPTYPQRTPAWCSPTALTNLVQYHTGSWPVGGLGSVWGESSNWYLAGKAGQPFSSGYFFHWLLGAGGYTVPADVKQSFSNANVEVIIWNWKALITNSVTTVDELFSPYANHGYANALFSAFQAYVEHHVWGINGARRPVAWGSSLAGHSRTITGSNGTEYFNNDPSSGSLNTVRSWADYRQQVMDSLTADKIEIIDTVTLQAAPRPETERRGVIWLLPANANTGFPGSVALIQGESGDARTNWLWDGDLGHAQGYYYQDLIGGLPSDPLFDVMFEVNHTDDAVEYAFWIQNISDKAYDFHVITTLMDANQNVLETLSTTDASVAAGLKSAFNPAGSTRLMDLSPGLYTLKFQLNQTGVVQDVKYVQFRVAEPGYLVQIPLGVLVQNAFCRKGPDPVFGEMTAFETGTELDWVGVNADRTWGLFEETLNEITFSCWIHLGSMEVTGEDQVLVIASPPLPEPEPSLCPSATTEETCTAAGGTWVSGLAAFCTCPED